MRYKNLALAFVVAIASAGASNGAFAENSLNSAVDHFQSIVGYHVPEAIDHTEEAISYGMAGDTAQLVYHAQKALSEAEADVAVRGNQHSALAVRSLQNSIEHGMQHQIKVATKDALRALTHLRAADD
jgi:hypothetical protein